jgi:hypothetical protein
MNTHLLFLLMDTAGEKSSTVWLERNVNPKLREFLEFFQRIFTNPRTVIKRTIFDLTFIEVTFIQIPLPLHPIFLYGEKCEKYEICEVLKAAVV